MEEKLITTQCFFLNPSSAEVPLSPQGKSLSFTLALQSLETLLQTM